jgi:hypothetical protein
VFPALAPVIVYVPQLIVGVAVNVTPVPVGEVSTIVGADVHPDPNPAYVPPPVVYVMLDGTPLTDTIVPVTTQLAPPPVDVNAVELAYPVPAPPIATVTPPANTFDTNEAVGSESYACRVSDP